VADRIEFGKGDLPWQPRGAEEPVVLHHYDMPLAGLVVQHGTSFFFWCIKGEVTQATLWGYTPVSDQERHEFEAEPRDQILRRLFSTTRPVTVGFGVEGRGIQKWTDIESGSSDEIESRAAELLDLAASELRLLDSV
jgi:hypothetical protein